MGSNGTAGGGACPPPLWPATTPCLGGTCLDASRCACPHADWIGRGDFLYGGGANVSESSTCLVYVPAVRALWATLLACALLALPLSLNVVRVARSASRARGGHGSHGGHGGTARRRTWTYYMAHLIFAMHLAHAAIGALRTASPAERVIGQDPLATALYCVGQLVGRGAMFAQTAQVNEVIRGAANVFSSRARGARRNSLDAHYETVISWSHRVLVASFALSLVASTAPLFMLAATRYFPDTFALGSVFFLGIVVPLTAEELLVLFLTALLLREMAGWSPSPKEASAARAAAAAAAAATAATATAPATAVARPGAAAPAAASGSGSAPAPARASSTALGGGSNAGHEPLPLEQRRRARARERVLRVQTLTFFSLAVWTFPDVFFGALPLVQSFSWVSLPLGYLLGEVAAFIILRNLAPPEAWPRWLRPLFVAAPRFSVYGRPSRTRTRKSKTSNDTPAGVERHGSLVPLGVHSDGEPVSMLASRNALFEGGSVTFEGGSAELGAAAVPATAAGAVHDLGRGTSDPRTASLGWHPPLPLPTDPAVPGSRASFEARHTMAADSTQRASLASVPGSRASMDTLEARRARAADSTQRASLASVATGGEPRGERRDSRW